MQHRYRSCAYYYLEQLHKRQVVEPHPSKAALRWAIGARARAQCRRSVVTNLKNACFHTGTRVNVFAPRVPQAHRDFACELCFKHSAVAMTARLCSGRAKAYYPGEAAIACKDLSVVVLASTRARMSKQT